MKNLFIIFFVSFVSLTSCCDYLNLDALIDEHRPAFQDLERHRNDISYTTYSYTTYNGNTTTRTTVYNYYFDNPDARIAFDDYGPKLNSLQNKTALLSVGDGFILGLLLSVANRIFDKTEVKPKYVIPAIGVTSILVNEFKNLNRQITPFFTEHTLQRRDNLFATFSPINFLNIFITTIGAGIGFVSGTYLIDYLKNNKKTKKESSKEQSSSSSSFK